MSIYDEDAVIAAADLCERAGARQFEIGFLHDGVPAEQAGWYAMVTLRGAKLIADDHRGPSEAADALARRILEVGRCRCGRVAVLSDQQATDAHTGRVAYADGSIWTVAEIMAAGTCRWRRMGPRWEPGCPAPNRAQRRQRRR